MTATDSHREDNGSVMQVQDDLQKGDRSATQKQGKERHRAGWSPSNAAPGPKETAKHSGQPATDLLLLPRGGAHGAPPRPGSWGSPPAEAHALTARLSAPDLEEAHVL